MYLFIHSKGQMIWFSTLSLCPCFPQRTVKIDHGALLSLPLGEHFFSPSHAHPIKSRAFTTSLAEQPPDSPTEYLAVSKPIQTPNEPPCASQIVLQHDFGNTYGMPPFEVPYNPPQNCSSDFSLVVLEWSAASKGRQFDRIFGIWLSGVEILRSCTAEPRASGMFWKFQKDITRFSSLLKRKQTLSVHLANIVDKTYTGVYHVNVSFHFYANKDERKSGFPSFLDSPADFIMPISRPPPLNAGYWFLVENSTNVQKKELKVPRNVYRAVLEVYVSYHSNDEFWYTNPSDEYILANNLTGVPGNGAFREVVVSLDGHAVGAVWPFTVVYTGGVNPLLWRPITGIGSFDLPSYDIEFTPFLGWILNKHHHTIEFSVTDALNVWYIDANLHLWIDSERERTKGKLLNYDAKPALKSVISDFKGLNGVFNTTAGRYILASGRVKTPHGMIHINSIQRFGYTNFMKFANNGSGHTVRQKIDASYSVYFTLPSYDVFSIISIRRFTTYLYTNNVDQSNGSYTSITDVSLGFNDKSIQGNPFGLSFSSLSNTQDARGFMRVNGSLVTSGFGKTKEVYKYDSSEGCYSRSVSSSNYSILYDHSSYLCSESLPKESKNQTRHSQQFLLRKPS